MDLQSMLDAGGDVTIPNDTYTSNVTLKGNRVKVTCAPEAIFLKMVVTIAGNRNDWNGGTFVNGQITITGDNNVVHDTLFRDGAKGHNEDPLNCAICTLGDASNNVIRNNEIHHWKRRGLRLRKPTSSTKGNVFTGNYLHDFVDDDPQNSGEAIQIGENQSCSQHQTKTTISNTLIDNFNLEGEIISLKSQDVKVHDVTIVNAKGGNLSLRASKNCVVSACWLEDTKGIVVSGDDNLIVSNELRGGSIIVRSGDATLHQYTKDKVENDHFKWQGAHPAAQNTIVAGNRGRHGAKILIGPKGRGGNEYYPIQHHPAHNTQVALDNDLAVELEDKHSDTQHDMPLSEVRRFTPRKLNPRDLTGTPPTPIDTTITDNLRAHSTLGPDPFPWIATVSPAQGTVEFLVDDRVVNRESNAPYGDMPTRSTPPKDFDGWNDPKSYTEGRHRLAVRHVESGETKATRVRLVHTIAPEISMNLAEGDTLGPAPFTWTAVLPSSDGVVAFLVDGMLVNRETREPYGDHATDNGKPDDPFNFWNDPKRYGAGTHVMTVRQEGTSEEVSVTVKMRV